MKLITLITMMLSTLTAYAGEVPSRYHPHDPELCPAPSEMQLKVLKYENHSAWDKETRGTCTVAVPMQWGLSMLPPSKDVTNVAVDCDANDFVFDDDSYRYLPAKVSYKLEACDRNDWSCMTAAGYRYSCEPNVETSGTLALPIAPSPYCGPGRPPRPAQPGCKWALYADSCYYLQCSDK